MKQAKEEAQDEIEKYRQERERQFKEFESKVSVLYEKKSITVQGMKGRSLISHKLITNAISSMQMSHKVQLIDLMSEKKHCKTILYD